MTSVPELPRVLEGTWFCWHDVHLIIRWVFIGFFFNCPFPVQGSPHSSLSHVYESVSTSLFPFVTASVTSYTLWIKRSFLAGGFVKWKKKNTGYFTYPNNYSKEFTHYSLASLLCPLLIMPISLIHLYQCSHLDYFNNVFTNFGELTTVFFFDKHQGRVVIELLSESTSLSLQEIIFNQEIKIHCLNPFWSLLSTVRKITVALN